jgi:hypothetical protein
LICSGGSVNFFVCGSIPDIIINILNETSSYSSRLAKPTYHLGRHAGWVHHLLSVALMLPRHAARWGLAIQIVRWRAMGCYLLIGAGFSRNWGGPLSEEICVAGMGAREAINIAERSAN